VLGAGALLQPGGDPPLDLLAAIVRVLAPEALAHEVHPGVEHFECEAKSLAKLVLHCRRV
jgi:hypothetical protein